MKEVKCSTCKGKGKVDVEINEISPDGRKTSNVTLTCVDCDGKGKISKLKAKALAEHKADWCQCEDVGHNVQYYADGQDRRCLKHHYRHEPGCGGIVQIG